jgi:transposase
MAGRRSKYTPETVDKLTQAIRLGATDELACDYAGIGTSTFYAWMDAKPEFQEAIKLARGAAAVKWLAKIEQAGEEAWQAFAWKLERRYPHFYGRNITEVSGVNGGPIQTEIILRQIPERKDD